MSTKHSIKAQNLPKGLIRGAKWSGYPCEARVVLVTVGATDWVWCVPYIGTERSAVEVKLDWGEGRQRTVYVDNADGRALQVILKGMAPLPGFRFLPAFDVKDDPEAKLTYQAAPGNY